MIHIKSQSLSQQPLLQMGEKLRVLYKYLQWFEGLVYR